MGVLVKRDTDVPALPDPEQVVLEGHRASEALLRVIRQNKEKFELNLGGRPYLRYEAWVLLGEFRRLKPSVEWTRPIERDGAVVGYEARAYLTDLLTGATLCSAEAQCTRDEPLWHERPKYEWRTVGGRRTRVQVGTEPVSDHALRSMAQTRACGKALRLALSWIVVLAGYEPTPAEEVIESAPVVTDGDGSQDVEPIPPEAQPKQENAQASDNGEDMILKEIKAHRDAMEWKNHDVAMLIEDLFGQGKRYKDLSPDQRVTLLNKMREIRANLSRILKGGGGK